MAFVLFVKGDAPGYDPKTWSPVDSGTLKGMQEKRKFWAKHGDETKIVNSRTNQEVE